MQYIVLDMEWNQAWPGSSARKTVPIRGEVIQLGAVRLTQEQAVADEFQVLVKPHFYRHLHKKVSSLTGIKEARLKAEGLPFAEAIAKFRAWCGEDCVFLTWGFDDIMILRENLTIHELPADWALRWYNAQMIFNAQTDGSGNQRGLGTALEMLEIEPTRQAHDALGDAYHTALICARLNLCKGISEYKKAVKTHEDGFHGAELPGCIARKVYDGMETKQAAMAKMAGEENLCPTCQKRMKLTRWLSQPGRRYMAMATCAEHGNFLVRIRLQTEDDDTLRVSKLLYEESSEAAKAYERMAAAPRKRPHRRRGKKAAGKTAEAKPEA